MTVAEPFSAPLAINFIFVNLTPRGQIMTPEYPNIGGYLNLFDLIAVNFHPILDMLLLNILNVHAVKPAQFLAQPVELSLVMPVDPIFSPDRLVLLNWWITL